jgi:hypothetical protein
MQAGARSRSCLAHADPPEAAVASQFRWLAPLSLHNARI